MISVIIPVYNLEPFISRCVQSFRRQTYTDFELIIIDDGSTDRSFDIISKFAAIDSRICVHHQNNQGVSVARNVGIEHARGEWITFVDGDDYVGKTYLEGFIRQASMHNADLVIGGFTTVSYPDYRPLARLIPPTDAGEEYAARICAVWAHFMRRSLITRYNVLFDTTDRYARFEDTAFSFFYSCMCKRLCFINSSQYYYVQRQNSAMHLYRGLKKTSLPYKGLQNAFHAVRSFHGPVIDIAFYEWFILRILSSLINYSRGAVHESEKLSQFIYDTIRSEVRGLDANHLIKLHTGMDVPMFQQAAVCLLKHLYKKRLLTPFLKLYLRI